MPSEQTSDDQNSSIPNARRLKGKAHPPLHILVAQRDIAAGKETEGDTTTLEDYTVLQKLRESDEG